MEEELLETLVTMETIAKLRSDLNDKISAYIDEHDLMGDYKVKTPFELKDEAGSFVECFEVEWADHLDPSYGKTVYFYLFDHEGNQTDGKYIYETGMMDMHYFYKEILLDREFEIYS